MNGDVNRSILIVVGAVSDYKSQVVGASLFDVYLGKCFVRKVLNEDIKNVVHS